MNFDPVVVLNLSFDVVIVLLGVVIYRSSKSVLVEWVATAFALFAFSYVLTIAEIADSTVLVPIRALGYLSVIIGLLLFARHRARPKPAT